MNNIYHLYIEFLCLCESKSSYFDKPRTAALASPHIFFYGSDDEMTVVLLAFCILSLPRLLFCTISNISSSRWKCKGFWSFSERQKGNLKSSRLWRYGL